MRSAGPDVETVTRRYHTSCADNGRVVDVGNGDVPALLETRDMGVRNFGYSVDDVFGRHGLKREPQTAEVGYEEDKGTLHE